jgi:hypothetical protein
MVEGADSAGVTVFVLDLGEPTELQSCAASGNLARQTLAQVRVDLVLDMKPQLLVELLLNPVASEKGAQPEDPIAQHPGLTRF